MRPTPPRYFSILAQVIWPVRAALRPLTVRLHLRGKPFSAEIDYPSLIPLATGLTIPSISWTRISFAWKKAFKGSRSKFLTWASSIKGQAFFLNQIELIQSEFVDRLYRLNPSERELVQCIRHFGPRDWVALRICHGKTICYETVGSGLLHLMSSRTADAKQTILSAASISFEERTIHRAAHLSECGYPTESVLLAFSVLDAAIQKFLIDGMVNKGIDAESARSLLRNTTTNRLSTYLDSILYLSAGKSLQKENPNLFKEVRKFNDLRNKVIHNGAVASRPQAKVACKTVTEILAFLGSLKPGVVPDNITLCFTGVP